MFTGIITDIGKVKSISNNADGKTIAIATGLDISKTEIGASISCNGACMTVVKKGDDENGSWFMVDVSGESLSKTTIGQWLTGKEINLETALKVGDELGGHLVSGHVDGLGDVVAIEPVGESLKLDIVVSPDLGRFVAPKGSITIDGVSLTVNTVKGDKTDKMGKNRHIFSLNIIPHTAKATTLGKLSVGDKVNVEIDTLARYVARLLDSKS